MISPSLSLTFATGISCCDVNGRLILLDQKADRYLALAQAEDQALRALIAGLPLDADAADRLENLTQQGLLMFSQTAASPKACNVILPTTAYGSSDSASLSTRIQLMFALRIMIARWRLRRSGLHARLRSLQIRKARLMVRDDAPAPALQEAANLLARITLFTTSHDQCLPIALGLADHLLRRRVSCNLVLGVQLGPFQAHCWIQHGDHLVGDDLDIVRTFTPIAVI